MCTKDRLLDHFRRHPKAQLQDLVKFLYQSEFGGGHLVSDEAASLCLLEQEAEPLFEDIGGGFCRLHLAAVRHTDLKWSTVNRMLIASSERIQGSAGSFENKLAVLPDLAGHDLPFSREEIRRYLDDYKKAGYSPVSHSAAYRAAYRVVKADYRPYIALFSAIDRLLSERERLTVAIDGNCASGKSTLAELVGGIYDCNLFHMDDFFLQPGQRTPERLSEAGGNVDYERFVEEVVSGILSRRAFQYRKFDCSKMALGETVKVQPKRLNIVEGAYSLHPKLPDYYDLKIFLRIDPAVQSERILHRDGAEMLKRFQKEWIPMENRYFEAFGIPQTCDLIFSS